MTDHDPRQVASDISILYEISLAVGRSLDLKANCDNFLRVLLARKNFSFGSVWLKSELLAAPAAAEPAIAKSGYTLVFGLPAFRIRDRHMSADHPLVTRLTEVPSFALAEGDMAFKDAIAENRVAGGAYMVFDLRGVGFLKLYRAGHGSAFREKDLNQLRNVVSKFAVSLEGCLAHQELLWEVAERKQVEEALRQSEERYRNVVERASDGILVVQNGTLVFANRRLAEMAGTPLSGVVGAPFTRFIHPAETQRVLDIYRRRLAGEKVPSVYETKLVDPAGNVLAVELTAGIITYDNQPATLVLIRDITDRKRFEAERSRLALALEQTADAVLITDTEGRIQHVNPAFETISGYTREEVLGRDPSVLKSESQDPKMYREMWASLNAGHVWRGRVKNRRKNGTSVVCDTIITPTRNEQGDVVGYVSVQRDITRELQMEEQYLQAQKMESIGRLAGGIAHDFNNIMTAILGFGTMILDQVGNNHTLRHAVEQIVSAGERATNLTRQLLTFSRKQMVEVRTLDLNAVIMEMTQLVRRALGEDVELSTQLDEDAGSIKADAGLIQQVVMNLAINARDAMPRGGKLLISTESTKLDEEACRTRVGLAPGSYILLSINDTGQGMAPEVLAHVFEPFYTTKPKGKGTGLGLATVYGIIQQCHGHIEIQSVVGQGTRVNIWIPRLDAVGDAVPVEIEDHPQRGSEKILVVEDEDIVRDLTVRILKSLGYEVIEAPNGKDGVAVFRKLHGHVDLVLTDVVMPQMGGPEMVEHLFEINPSVRVLYTSGFSEIAVTEHGAPVGKDRLIQKPYSRELLAQRVREVLDRKRA